MVLIKIKRATRQKITEAATSGKLNQGEPYIVTDENRIEIGTSRTSSETVSMLGDIADTYAAGYTVKSATQVNYSKTSASGRFAHLRGGVSVIGAVTFQQALADAASKGVRLPTVDEIEDEIVKGTGGGYDFNQCWTCSAVPGMPGHVYTKLGTGGGARNPTPTDDSATAYTRYVANVTVPFYGVPEAPADGKLYARKNGAWVEISATVEV